MDPHDRLVSLLARRAYREGEFVLSSGRRSDFYLDAKQVTYHPEGARLVGEAVLERIERYDVGAIGGPTMGADAIVAATICASQAARRPIPGFVVRKDAKGHGLQKWIEGILPPKARVAVVDDVITSGRSVLRAVDVVRREGCTVAVVIGLVDREEGGADEIRRRGLPFEAVCTLGEVRAAAGRSLSETTP